MHFTGELGLGLVGGFFSFLVVAGMLSVGKRVERRPLEHPPLPLGRFLGVAVLILVMAVLEEGVFRWFMIGQGSRWVGLVPAFLASMALFALAHRPNGPLHYGAVLNLLLVGMVLGWVYWWWGIWVAAAAHAGWNLAEWGLGYTVSGEKTRQYLPSPAVRVIPGEPFGPEAHWSTTVVLLLVAMALVVK